MIATKICHRGTEALNWFNVFFLPTSSIGHLNCHHAPENTIFKNVKCFFDHLNDSLRLHFVGTPK